jgi:hypothetical protein
MINVYIASTDEPVLKNMVFSEFSNLEYKNDHKWSTWYHCKPTQQYMKNLYVFYSPNNVDYKMPIPEENDFEIKRLGVHRDLVEAWADTKNVVLKPSFYLWCEKSLQVSITSPYMHNSVLCKSGFIVPAIIDINEWYRRTQPCLQTYPGIKSFNWEKGEPIFYLKFHTDEKINFIEYPLTQECYDLEVERARWGILEKDLKHRPEWYLEESKNFIKEHGGDRDTLNKRIMDAIDKSISLKNEGIVNVATTSKLKRKILDRKIT